MTESTAFAPLKKRLLKLEPGEVAERDRPHRRFTRRRCSSRRSRGTDSAFAVAHVANNFPITADTARWSVRERLPVLCRISRLSKAKSFMRTFDGARSPASLASIATSMGQGGLLALVIIAKTV